LPQRQNAKRGQNRARTGQFSWSLGQGICAVRVNLSKLNSRSGNGLETVWFSAPRERLAEERRRPRPASLVSRLFLRRLRAFAKLPSAPARTPGTGAKSCQIVPNRAIARNSRGRLLPNEPILAKNCTGSASVLPHETSWPKLPQHQNAKQGKNRVRTGQFFGGRSRRFRHSAFDIQFDPRAAHAALLIRWPSTLDFRPSTAAFGVRHSSFVWNPVHSVHPRTDSIAPRRAFELQTCPCDFHLCSPLR